MTDVVLIDTSCWTQALRTDGDTAVRQRVEMLIKERRAAWCDVVRLELWAGVRPHERGSLRRLDASIPRLPIDEAVWALGCQTADVARDRGLTVPPNDFLVWACAKRHSVVLEHADRHFERLNELT